ncbi:toll-like receptor 2 type-2 [Haemaphysalis longicornis]
MVRVESHGFANRVTMIASLGTLVAILIGSSKAKQFSLGGNREQWSRAGLLPLPQCNVTLQNNGHVTANCKVLIQALPEQWFVPSDPEVMTLEENLVTSGPVNEETLLSGHPVFLSLKSANITKWDDFPERLQTEYHIIPLTSRGVVGGFSLYYVMVFIRRLQVTVKFSQPPVIAVTKCTKMLSFGRLQCKVFGLMEKFFIDSRLQPFLLPFKVNSLWNLYSSVIHTANFTFAEAVKSIPANILYLLAPMRIWRIVLYACNFKQIQASDIPPMRYLVGIDFNNVPLESVHCNAFDMIPDIRNVSFIGSKLPAIPEALFSLQRLRSLDMSRTMVEENSSFHLNTNSTCKNNSNNSNKSNNSSSATSLILAGTPLRRLKDRSFCRFPSLKRLDISECSIEDITASPFICLTDLRELNMAKNQIISINPSGFEGLNSLEILKIQRNKLTCFPGAAFFNSLPSLVSLLMSSNDITGIELHGIERLSLKNLDLSGNSLYNWTPPLFSLMPVLAHLNITGNQLYEIKSKMYADVTHVNALDICSNPWDCASCSLNYLHALLNQSAVGSSVCAQCKEPQSLVGIRAQDIKWNRNICAPHFYDYYVTTGIPTIFAVLVSTVTSYSLYAGRWYIRYLLLYLRVKIRNFKRQSQTTIFLWDAFLSYHDDDANWAKDVLLSRLESPEMGFRICVAERDFIPGIPIAENICHCISESRTSLFIISQKFCQSRWCMFEVTLAQHRLFECEREDHLVFIKRNLVGESEMSPVLSFLTKSRTYIDASYVGGCAKQQDLFWLKLQAALQK